MTPAQKKAREVYQKSDKGRLRMKEAAQRLQRKRFALLQKLKKVPCADCGERYPHYVMDFDHREPEIKSFSLSQGYRAVGLARLLEEVKKCDVVCANCHRERTWGHLKRTGK